MSSHQGHHQSWPSQWLTAQSIIAFLLLSTALLPNCATAAGTSETTQLRATQLKATQLKATQLDTTRLETTRPEAIRLETSQLETTQLKRFDLTEEQIKSRDLRVLATPKTEASAADKPVALQRVTSENFSSLVRDKVALVEKVDANPETVKQADTTVWQSQYRVLMPKSEREPEQVWTLRPIVRVLNALQYDESKRQFQARLSLGVIDENKPGLRRELAVPFMMDVASDTLRSISPQRVRLDSSATFMTVDVFDNAPTEPASVRVLLAGDDSTGSEIELSVRRPTLQLTLNPARILGMGLETAQLTVSAVGLLNPAGMSISLGTDRGRFQSPVLILDAQGFATTTLRSSGLGEASIEAMGSPFGKTTTTVSFSVPWTFVIAALLGGLVGAVATRGGRAHFINTAITGVATGLIAAVLFAVGINVIGFEPTAQVGEALTFAIAAVGAVLGPSILGKSSATQSHAGAPDSAP